MVQLMINQWMIIIENGGFLAFLSARGCMTSWLSCLSEISLESLDDLVLKLSALNLWVLVHVRLLCHAMPRVSS